jgi:predicted O-methyltransferase YrrM
MADNLEPGTVYFVDPSLVDDYWKDSDRVQRRFEDLGVGNVRHFLMTTQQFVETDEYRGLGQVQIVFIDGYHTEEQARYDYEALEHLVPPEGVILLHDSVRVATARLYGDGREYQRQVKYFVDKLKQDPRLQVFDFPYAEGLTLVRKTGNGQVV